MSNPVDNPMHTCPLAKTCQQIMVQEAEAEARSMAALYRAQTDKLKSSNDELQQFAYAASHDLREPLAKIQAFGKRLEARYADELDERGKEYITVMRSAATRMTRLIDDLLTFSRIERNGPPHVAVPLKKVIPEVLSLLSESLNGAEISCAPDLPTVYGDESQFFILFQNLLSNSLKFHKPDTPAKVWISATENENNFVIKVRDEGIGFSPEHDERIFKIFERLHTRFDFPGTGIGLALCKRIAERHGGTITAVGRPGEGATFRVALPKEPLH